MTTRTRRVRRGAPIGVGACILFTSVVAAASTITPGAPASPHALAPAPTSSVPAAALPSAAAHDAPVAADRRTPARAAGSPTIPAPPDADSDYGIQFDPISTKAQRAKVRIDLPFLVMHTYLTTCIVSATYTSPCPGHTVPRLPKLPYDYTWDVAYADNWVARRVGGKLVYGQFPPVRVSLLAFGSIPVSATVHLSQVVRNGRYLPLKLTLPIDVSPVPVGKRVPGFGPAPSFGANDTFFTYLGTATGAVDIRLSDVTVDRVPLNVGPSCRTSKPAQLYLTSPAGYYPGNVSPRKLRGRPGAFQPLNAGAGGYLEGNADVPSFSGCHNGNDDLDRLMTDFVSGPTNAVTAYSPQALQSWCEEPVAHCAQAATAADRVARTLRSPAQVRAALSDPDTRTVLARGAPAVPGPPAP